MYAVGIQCLCSKPLIFHYTSSDSNEQGISALSIIEHIRQILRGNRENKHASKDSILKKLMWCVLRLNLGSPSSYMISL